MHRFSAHNALGWIAGAAGLVALFGFQVGLFNGTLGLVVFLCALIVGAWWIYQQYERWQHARRLKEFAQQNGWTYVGFGHNLVSTLTGFPFSEGTESRVEDVVEGTYGGMPCRSFTYTFKYSFGGEASAEQVFTVTQTRLPVPVPRLDLVPEDAGSRILGALAGSDIQLESAEFNRTWRVLCADRRFAIDVVDPRMMRLLLNHRLPGVAIRIEGNRVLAWSAGRSDVSELSRRLDVVTGVARRIPDHVIRTYSESERARQEAEQQRRADEAAREAAAPTWANTGGVLNSGQYTGIGVDADGDGIDDWEQRNR